MSKIDGIADTWLTIRGRDRRLISAEAMIPGKPIVIGEKTYDCASYSEAVQQGLVKVMGQDGRKVSILPEGATAALESKEQVFPK